LIEFDVADDRINELKRQSADDDGHRVADRDGVDCDLPRQPATAGLTARWMPVHPDLAVMLPRTHEHPNKLTMTLRGGKSMQGLRTGDTQTV
jgi:hypothetical protein